MKPMIWAPDEKDAQVNQYLDRINHEPFALLGLLLVAGFSFFVIFMLTGIF